MNEYFVRRDCCPVCQSSEIVELVRTPLAEPPLRNYLLSFYSPQGGVELEYLDEQDYVLGECVDCGLVYQSEIPDEWLMGKLYEEWIDPKVVFESVEKCRPIGYFSGLSKEIMGIVRYFGRLPSELRLLDFGMGWGHWCRMAQALGCTVYGTELSADRIEYARETGVRVIGYEEIPAFSFDFINAEQVFEHLAEPRETLAHLRRSLNAGGY